MSRNIPDDENGSVLKRMVARGDKLDKPRMIDFCFVFSTREDALKFAAIVDEIDLEVCLSYYEGRSMWQAIVKKFMIPEHAEIGALEADLTRRAALFSGVADGWGCMRITG